MTLDQLRIFVAVAERCHVTRAAEALNIAQSAVSGAVSALRDGTGPSCSTASAGTMIAYQVNGEQLPRLNGSRCASSYRASTARTPTPSTATAWPAIRPAWC